MPDDPYLGDALAQVILRMTSELDPTDVLRAVVAGLVDELDAALARIWLLEPGASSLHLVASAGLSTSTHGAHREIPVGSLKIGAIAATRAPVCTNEVRSDPRVENKEWVEREGLRAFAGYPLQFRDELLGVLGLFSRRALTSDEFERLGTFAASRDRDQERATLRGDGQAVAAPSGRELRPQGGAPRRAPGTADPRAQPRDPRGAPEARTRRRQRYDRAPPR